MGQEIVYCHKCQKRILGSDFAKGKAFRVVNQVTCSACAPELIATLPAKERDELWAQMIAPGLERGATPSSEHPPPLTSSSSRTRALSSTPRSTPTVASARAVRPADSKRVVHMSLLGVGVALVVVVFFALRGGSSGRREPPPEPESRPAGSPSPRPDLEESRRLEAAREELRKAFEFSKAYPNDLDGQIAAWRSAFLATDRTPSGAEAKRELDRVLERRKEIVERSWSELLDRIRAPLEKEEFASAIALCQAARAQRDASDWTLRVDQKIAEIKRNAADLLPGLKEKAAAAHQLGAADTVKALRERIAKWGIPECLNEFDRALALLPGVVPAPAPAPAPSPAPATKAPPKEAKAPSPQWEAALARAALGDFAGAARELGSAVAAIADPAAKSAATEDQEAIRRAGVAVDEAREALARMAKGQKLSVERWTEGGLPERVEGTVAGSNSTRLFVRRESGIETVELGEVTPASLAEIFLARSARKPEADVRTAVLLCLLGGDLKGARTLAESQKVQLPARLWAYGDKLALAAPPAKEAEARRRFYDALEFAWDPKETGAAIEIYGTLLREYGDTAFVARNRASIVCGGALGKEYLFFPAMMTGAGSFKLSSAGKVEQAWASERDTEASATVQNFVEFSFFALPATEYRLWLYAAGCCQETFTFGVQGTDMVLPNARSTTVEPGGAAFATVKPSVSLKRTHTAHLGPKNPAHWEWIPVALPKYPAGGVKVVRILTDQRGFAVAYASVSSTTSSAPREFEVKELEKLWSQRRAGGSLEPTVGDLVGFWPFEEGTGASTADASAKAGPAVLRGATWTVGRSGAGLLFDGQNSYVELPLTPALETLNEGNYSLAAWYRPERLPPGTGDSNEASDGIVVKAGLHTGTVYTHSGAFSFMHWILDPNDPSKGACIGATSKPFPPGEFYHVVGVVDRAGGTIALYVNGKLDGTGRFNPNGRAWKYEPTPWRVGIGGPGLDQYRWPAKGVIDEVRLYARALSESEVGTLVRAKRPARPGAGVSPAGGSRPWKKIFDGESPKFLSNDGAPGWVVKDGALHHVVGVDDAGRSREDYDDGEFRIRFDAKGGSKFWFSVRQTALDRFSADIDKEAPDALQGEHELVFRCKGESVTATLDGKALRLVKFGTPLRGALQFNCDLNNSLLIRGIDFREVK